MIPRPAPPRPAAALAAPVALALLAAAASAAEPAPPGSVVVAARAVPSRTVLAAGDVALARLEAPGALSSLSEAVGLETRVALYPGRPVRPDDLAPPAMVERNDLVTLVWTRGPLIIRAEGRALDRAALGERLRAMNLGSRATVTGRVSGPGVIEVGR